MPNLSISQGVSERREAHWGIWGQVGMWDLAQLESGNRGDFGEVATRAKDSGQHFSSIAFPAFWDFYAFRRRDRNEF